jgi:hypothetical protein
VQATLETAFGYTGIVDTRCTDPSGTCVVDFEDAPTEVVSVIYEKGGTYVGPLMPRWQQLGHAKTRYLTR